MKSNYLQVVRSVYSGVSQRQASKAHGVSRDTVTILLRYAKRKGWCALEDLTPLTEEDFAPAMKRQVGPGANRDVVYELPDYHEVHSELAKEHVTLTLLWEEYVERCMAENKQYYKETQFRRYYHTYAKTSKATIRLEHKPGLAMQVDWAGTTVAYYDEELGQAAEGHLFVAVLPCSSLIYAEAFPNEQLPNWLAAHNHAFTYFGGTPKTLVPDNLKTGVTRPDRYDPVLNASYQELAEHYGTVILPARVRKPQDKAAVENGVRIASRRILARLRNVRIRSYAELCLRIAECLEAVNEAPLTGRNVSRWQAFLEEEKDYLLTLPSTPYVLSEWSEAKVQTNCHIVYQTYFYSVPFEYVSETVDVRATQDTLEIYYHHQRIASHRRLRGKSQYSTVQDHMPPHKVFFAEWNTERFLTWSAQMGPSCRHVMQTILDQAVVEQQAYRTCFGLLSLKDKYTAARLERACGRALTQSEAPTYSHVKRILERSEDLQQDDPKHEAKTQPRGYRRGADYYKQEMQGREGNEDAVQ